MDQPDDLGRLSTVASIAGAVAIGLWRVFAKAFKRKEEKMLTSLDIGGTAPEIQFASRLAAIETRMGDLFRANDERHQQNTGNIDRILDELGEQRKMLMSVVRKLAGMS